MLSPYHSRRAAAAHRLILQIIARDRVLGRPEFPSRSTLELGALGSQVLPRIQINHNNESRLGSNTEVNSNGENLPDENVLAAHGVWGRGVTIAFRDRCVQGDKLDTLVILDENKEAYNFHVIVHCAHDELNNSLR